MQVFLHTLFLEYATETGGNKCKAALYTYKQIGMRSLELFWPCSILAKNLGDVLPAAFQFYLAGNSFSIIVWYQESILIQLCNTVYAIIVQFNLHVYMLSDCNTSCIGLQPPPSPPPPQKNNNATLIECMRQTYMYIVFRNVLK